MPFVFTKLFYVLLAAGFVPLSLSWQRPALRWVTLVYDGLLLLVAFLDSSLSRLPASLVLERGFEGRFAVGAETEVRVKILNNSPRAATLILKDEYPPEMKLANLREGQLRVEARTKAMLVYKLTPPRRGRFEFGLTAVRYLSRLGLVWKQTRMGLPASVKVYPNMRRAREAELKALGARSLAASHRKSSWRGEGREFESLRDYVRGDELRHVSGRRRRGAAS
jgi:uncharacterized protein (DUF58 family)